MRLRLTPIILTCLLSAASVASEDYVLRSRSIGDLAKAGSTSVFSRQDTDVLGVRNDATYGSIATLRFNRNYSRFGQDLATASDWSPYNLVQLRVKNTGSKTASFIFITLLTSDPNNYNGAFTGEFEVRPNETKRFMFHLNVDNPEPFGMEYLPPVISAGYEDIMAGTSFRNLKTIKHWRISHHGDTPSTVEISELRLLRQSLDFSGMVDAYGQYTGRDWTELVNADTDFLVRKTAETTSLAANPGPGEQHGSIKLVSVTPSTGKWTVVTEPSGRKYMKHPNGRLFWSLGISGINEGMATPVEGRESYFQSLPSRTGRFADAYADRKTRDGTLLTFSFHQKNLMMKYGDDYLPGWSSAVKKRLSSWGVNTIGIQSSSSLLDGSFPYTLILSTSGFPTRVRPPSMLWGSLPDPYASNFRSWMQTEFAETLAEHNGRQSFMGLFVDNELSWGNTKTETARYNIPRGLLNSDGTQPAKIAFVNQLKDKYVTIGKLNTAWAKSFSSWDTFQNTKWLPTTFTASMKTDFNIRLKAFAVKYYSEVKLALNASGLTALYLGSKLSDWTPEVLDAADNYVDVLCMNFYRFIEDVDWDYLNSLGKPVLISEMGYSTKAKGTFGGMAPVYSHAERAYEMKRFYNKALALNNLVGVHWYSYVDQPATGRWTDYENAGLGLVDIADNPYPETVAALRDISRNMYSVRG